LQKTKATVGRKKIRINVTFFRPSKVLKRNMTLIIIKIDWILKIKSYNLTGIVWSYEIGPQKFL
jgi:malonyl CoA-acyl carrier protein transacylase